MKILMYESPVSIDGWIVEFFENGFNETVNPIISNTIFIIICLFCSVLFAGLIGFSREKNGYPAGLRTHMLLSLGSTLIMILSIYAVPGTSDTRDPMRLAAAGVTGIGFLGAGAIMQNGFSIKGLTSAASIWVTMAIGMACGAGFLVLSLVGTLLTFCFLTFFRKFEFKASSKNAMILLVTHPDDGGLERVLEVAENLNMHIQDFSSSFVKEGGSVFIRTTFRASGSKQGDMEKLVLAIQKDVNPVECKILR